MCCLPDHKHKWIECEKNPRSNTYSGTHYSKVWESSKKQEEKKRKVELMSTEDKYVSWSDEESEIVSRGKLVEEL